MKRVALSISILLMCIISFAQAPQKMSYQAVIRDAGNALVINHAVGMRICILQGSAGGTVVYTETQTPTTNANGLVTIEIGGGTGFDAIDWANGPYFIKTETDPTGGTSFTITGSSQLLSVPYALHAKTSETSTDAVKISGNQTIAGNKTFSGTTTVSTPVNATDAANKAYVDALKSQIEELQLLSGIKIKDIDGNVYKTVTIGTQIWMAENLKTIKYNDGTVIPLVTDGAGWAALTTPAYCWFNNDESTYKAAYGALYNWYTVNTGTLCPTGWHVPSDAEWTTLTTYLGESVAGGKLKEAGTTHWASPNTGATNETGYTALPGGYRCSCAAFYSIGYFGFWWSATENVVAYALIRGLYYSNSDVYRNYNYKKSGFSVRCLRD